MNGILDLPSRAKALLGMGHPDDSDKTPTVDLTGDLVKAAKRWRRAVARQEATQAELREAVNVACDAGVSESEAARLTGVDRMTVRRWRGKRTWQEQHGRDTSEWPRLKLS